MNTIRNDLPQKTKDFFKKMENYLDTELIFYGSVIRSDYVPGKSDIDVAVFTDNENSIMSKLQHFLHVKRNEFDKVVWKLEGKMIYGYKIKILEQNTEIAIYNNDFKEQLMEELNKPIINKTFLTTTLLLLLKLFYYQLPLIPTDLYLKCKRYVLNDMMGKKESVFHLIRQH
jgi:predicted nucleotidyltransferase